MSRNWPSVAVLIAIFGAPMCLAQPLPVDAVPIFHGEARTGDGRRIPGSIAFTVRVISQVGAIEALDFTGFSTQNPSAMRGVTGLACQRWLASNDDSHYDTPSPGFSTITNLSGEQSLDTHFLFNGDLSHYMVSTLLTETGVRFHGGNPFPSTPSVGFGLGGETGFPNPGRLQGSWSIAQVAQTSSVDAIYVVAGGSVGVSGRALVEGGWHEFQFGVAIPAIPEPSTALVLFAQVAVVYRRASSNCTPLKKRAP